ncbi:MAG: hypothetical protein JWQ81_6072 [Amycolatopsis sp.]|uniref:hypothetical protein n=1 Tax=Amycolatopsis sp. TaxID=37632 RepID=UPI00262AFA22|nr:hypothetical protein [Amycolatopsis sp.]MCU1685333.1 hypothetical protein [Amycolatopsis sp.]
MITLKFLATWLKIIGFTALALLAEGVFVHSVGWFVALAAVTALVFAGLTVALWREWRSVRNGSGAYTYQLIHYLRD